MDTGQRRLVATMPLHAITSTYGEEGLRERFAVETESWPAEDRRRLNKALDLASLLHANDRREREPYVNHLLRVAIRIMSHYGVHDPDVICAALLHDAVEDHAASWPAASMTRGRARGAGGGVRAAGSRACRCRHQPAVRAGPGRARAVPGACRGKPAGPPVGAGHQSLRLHDNGVGLIHTTGPRLRTLAGKYAPLVPILRELIGRPDTPLDAAARQHILAQLDRAADRFAAVLPSLGERNE